MASPTAPSPERASSPTGLATFDPACFALVMATGIVSIACQQLGYGILAATLFHLNIVCYVVLCGP